MDLEFLDKIVLILQLITTVKAGSSENNGLATDGELLIKKLVSGLDISTFEEMYMFTAPFRICNNCDIPKDDIKIMFPLYNGKHVRTAYAKKYSRDFDKIYSNDPHQIFTTKFFLVETCKTVNFTVNPVSSDQTTTNPSSTDDTTPNPFPSDDTTPNTVPTDNTTPNPIPSDDTTPNTIPTDDTTNPIPSDDTTPATVSSDGTTISTIYPDPTSWTGSTSSTTEAHVKSALYELDPSKMMKDNLYRIFRKYLFNSQKKPAPKSRETEFEIEGHTTKRELKFYGSNKYIKRRPPQTQRPVMYRKI